MISVHSGTSTGEQSLENWEQLFNAVGLINTLRLQLAPRELLSPRCCPFRPSNPSEFFYLFITVTKYLSRLLFKEKRLILAHGFGGWMSEQLSAGCGENPSAHGPMAGAWMYAEAPAPL